MALGNIITSDLVPIEYISTSPQNRSNMATFTDSVAGDEEPTSLT
jgi:hypothetical protein